MNKFYYAMSAFSAISMVINTWLMVIVTQNTNRTVTLLENLNELIRSMN